MNILVSQFAKQHNTRNTDSSVVAKRQKSPMPAADRQPPTGLQVGRQVERLLAERIPSGWSLQARRVEALTGHQHTDLLAEVASPAGETAVLAVDVKKTLEPRDILRAVKQLSTVTAGASPDAVPVVAAAYLSPRTRALLRDRGVGYVDTTGNVRIEISTPGLFIATDGADRDPWPRDHKLRSLRGRGAARAMRAIIDSTPPYGIRERAGATGASAPTLSRVLDLLEREAIVTRVRGAVSAVDWQAAIRRWAEDYDQTGSNAPTTALEPRGLRALEKKLRATNFLYAATGALAAQQFDPVAPARLAGIYVMDAIEAIDRLDLRRTDAGANVVLLEPLDPVVFDRTVERDGLRSVALSQLAVDLLTGPGREPAQGEQMLKWMEKNERVWRP